MVPRGAWPKGSGGIPHTPPSRKSNVARRGGAIAALPRDPSLSSRTETGPLRGGLGGKHLCRCITPKEFQLVEIPCLRMENVDDEVDKVHQDPTGTVKALHVEGS